MAITISGSTGISGIDGSASTPAVQGSDTNTGIYYPAADQVAVTANGSQVLLATASGVTVTGTASISGDMSFNSGYGSATVVYGCRAWVNFSGTGTVAIRGSGNVSSITDNGTGIYTVNFTNAMPDVNYCAVLGGENISGIGNAILNGGGTRAVGSIQLLLTDHANTLRDDDTVQVAIFR